MPPFPKTILHFDSMLERTPAHREELFTPSLCLLFARSASAFNNNATLASLLEIDWNGKSQIVSHKHSHINKTLFWFWSLHLSLSFSFFSGYVHFCFCHPRIPSNAMLNQSSRIKHNPQQKKRNKEKRQEEKRIKGEEETINCPPMSAFCPT